MQCTHWCTTELSSWAYLSQKHLKIGESAKAWYKKHKIKKIVFGHFFYKWLDKAQRAQREYVCFKVFSSTFDDKMHCINNTQKKPFKAIQNTRIFVPKIVEKNSRHTYSYLAL